MLGVGLKNFKYLFATKDAFIITRNTILYNVAFIIINTVPAVFVAILLAEMTSRMKKILVTYPFIQKYFVKGITLGGIKG